MKKNIKFLFTICYCILVLASCQKEFSNETITSQIATGSLSGSTGNCIYDSVAGTFYGGVTPDADTAYVEVKVNVTAIGTYSISTDLQNGFKFIDSGVFTNTGINTIRLKPVGKPILPSTTTFIVSFDSSFCSFSIDVKDDNQWQFTTPDNTFIGTIDTSYFGDTALWVPPGKLLNITGFTSNTKDSALVIWIYLPYGFIRSGSYTTYIEPPAENEAFFIFFKNASSVSPDVSGDAIYESSAALHSPTQTNITVTIASYDSNTNLVTGTFSGTAEIIENGYGTGKTIDITNGSFTATVSK